MPYVYQGSNSNWIMKHSMWVCNVYHQFQELYHVNSLNIVKSSTYFTMRPFIFFSHICRVAVRVETFRSPTSSRVEPDPLDNLPPRMQDHWFMFVMSQHFMIDLRLIEVCDSLAQLTSSPSLRSSSITGILIAMICFVSVMICCVCELTIRQNIVEGINIEW